VYEEATCAHGLEDYMKNKSILVGLLFVSSTAFAEKKQAEEVNFQKELLTIEEQVNELKERVFQSKATLKLLKEIVIQGAISDSHATVWHVNQLGSIYIVESIAYFVDGQGQYAKSDTTGALDEMSDLKVYDSTISPGNHTLNVNVTLGGNGLGIFSYVDEYTFKVQSATKFQVNEGEDCQIRVIIDERPGISHSYFERPQVSFEPRCRKLSNVD